MGSRVSCWCLGSVWERSRISALGPTLLLLPAPGQGSLLGSQTCGICPSPAPAALAWRALLRHQRWARPCPHGAAGHRELSCHQGQLPGAGCGAGLWVLPEREPRCHELALNVWLPSTLISALGIISAAHLRLLCTILNTARDLGSYCVDIPVIDTIFTTDLNCWDSVEMDFDLEVTRVLVILHVQLLPFCEMHEDLYFGGSYLLLTAKNFEKQGLYIKFCLFSHWTSGSPPIICFSICTPRHSFMFCLFEKSFVCFVR